jgi:uncharacterized surface protein with fasciclin (FAS1) repeats
MMKKFLISFACTLMLAGGPVPAHAADIIDTAEHAGSLKKFVAAIKETDLAATLKQAGPYTMFAPSDSAISKLPKGKWETLLKDRASLKKLVAMHIVPGKLLVSEVKPGDMTTMEGHSIHLTSDNGMVTVNGARITQSDLEADNGVIHEIDGLMLPDQ